MSLSSEGIWFDQSKYEQAEAKYQQIVAQRHGGLKIEGKAIGKTSVISTEIEKAMNLIGQSLAAPPATNSRDLEKRVTQIEKENAQLRATLASVQSRLSALESKLSVAPIIEPPSEVAADDSDDFDLFGSDDEAEMEKLKQQRLSKYAEKKAKKPKVIAKSSLVIDVKPWDDETDVTEMEKAVRSINTEGLVWGASKFVPVAYGIKKLQISCVIEDDKVGTDFLEESITAFKDLVQSMDIIAFNKI